MYGITQTILYTSAIYCCGCLMLATSTLWLWRAGAFLSLFCIAVGTGGQQRYHPHPSSPLFQQLNPTVHVLFPSGIKPCVATFGADQFAAGENRDEASVRSYFMVC